jgi:hypothetical protein
MSHACKFLANYLFLDPRERERMAGVLQRRTDGNGNGIDDQMQNGVDY